MDRARLLRLLPGLVVSVGFLSWFAWTAEWQRVGESLAGVRLPWVFASAMVLFSEFFIRTLRWRVLLAPMRTAEGRPPTLKIGRLFFATVVGMSLNVVLPFRAGDFARPYLGSRETGLSIPPLVTIAVMERVFDILGLVSVLLLMVATLPDDAAAHGPLVTNLEVYGGIFGIAGMLGLATMVGMAVARAQARSLFLKLATLLPGPVQGRVIQLYEGLCDGLDVVRSLRVVGLAMGLSLIHWTGGALSIYLLFRAFSLDLPFAAAAFTTVAIALAAALPQAPGFFGVFHAATEKTLVLWGQAVDPSKAYAIVLWGVSFIPLAIVGALLFWREGLKLSELRGAPKAETK